MTIVGDTAVVSPLLVGRAAYMEALVEAANEARRGRGQVAIIVGEAGIGKSRLVGQLKDALRPQGVDAGWRVLEAQCFEPGSALPFAPLLEMLREQLARLGTKELGAEGEAATALARLLARLSAPSEDLARAAGLEPQQEKWLFFEAFGQYCRKLAAQNPLLLIVEDLHWSDESSLQALLHVARRLAGQRILLVFTCRGDEDAPVLTHFWAELDRLRVTTQIELPRLTPGQVDQMLRAIFALQRPVRQDFLHATCELTGGNPFFIEEMLKSLIVAGDIFYTGEGWDRKPLGELRIPRSIQDAVRNRSEKLSAAARELLSLAAVAGQRFDFAVLCTLTGRDEDELQQLIKELLAAGLVEELSAEQFAFRHALTRQALYGQLLVRERQARHRAVAKAMEEIYAQAADTHAPALAYHCYAGALWDKALAYAQRAGELAQQMYAPREAIEQFSRALDAANHLPAATATVAILHRRRGQAYEVLGKLEHAADDYQRLLDLAVAGGERVLEWQALLDLGLLWAAQDYTQTGEYYQRALALVQTLNDPALLAQTLNRTGNWHLNLARPQEALHYYRQALAVFEGLDDQRGVAKTLELLGMASGQVFDEQTLAFYDRAIALFRRLDDRYGLVMSLIMRGMLRGLVGARLRDPPALSQNDLDEALKVAREISWRSAEAFGLGNYAWVLGAYGEYGRALELARNAMAVAQEIDHQQWTAAGRMIMGAAYLDPFALPRAREYLEQGLALAQQIGSLIFRQQAAGLLACVYILQGDRQSAAQVLDAAEAAAQADFTQPATYYQQVCTYARALLALAEGRPEITLALTATLLVQETHGASMGSVTTDARLLRSEALAALGDTSGAEELLLAALQGAQAEERRPRLWRLYLALGRVYWQSKRNGEAERALATAAALVEELAAEIEDEDLRRSLIEGAQAQMRPLVASSARATAKRRYGGLTERERAVTALIAEGKSNSEIADALVVGKRTVETHIGNIMTKLGVRTRSQIAVWAVERGLREDSAA